MLVETFECQETAEETMEASDVAIALIDQLGLDGQKELLKPRESGGGLDRNPYRKITDEESFVYSTICSQRTDLKKYAEGPIPVRVLQVAAHASEFFDRITVWHVPGVSVKDPVLIGVKAHPSYSNLDKEHFILARWGEALDEWPAMVKTAIRTFKDTFAAGTAEMIAKRNSDMALLESGNLATAMKLATWKTTY